MTNGSSGTEGAESSDGFWYLLGIAEEIMLTNVGGDEIIDRTAVKERIVSLQLDERPAIISVLEQLVVAADFVESAATDSPRRFLRIGRQQTVRPGHEQEAIRARIAELAQNAEAPDTLHDDPGLRDVSNLGSEGHDLPIRELMTTLARCVRFSEMDLDSEAALTESIRRVTKQGRLQLAEAARVAQTTVALILMELAEILNEPTHEEG